MTINQFLDKLNEYPAKWFLTGGAIRSFRDGQDHCPLSIMTNGNIGDPVQEGITLGLSFDDAGKIYFAADDSVAASPQLRKRLLAVTVEKSIVEPLTNAWLT